MELHHKIFLSLACILVCISQTFSKDAQPPMPKREELELAQVYFNFSMDVAHLYSDALMNESMSSASGGPPMPDNGIILTSMLGLVHSLAVTKEQPLAKPIAVPIFEKLLQMTSKKLPDAYELIMKTLDKKELDLSIMSQLYTSEDIKTTPALEKLKVEIIKSDLKDGGSVAKINSQLKEKLVSPMEEAYIPEGLTLSPAAVALLLDSLHLTESWPVPPTKLDKKAKFGGDADPVEMIELKGMFGYLESVGGIEINIPFQNDKRFISFVLPYKVELTETGELKEPMMDEPKALPNATMVRIQMPVFKTTIREPAFSGSSICDFKKEENFLQLLDDLLFISLDSNKFEAVSISGAQVNNVEVFKKEAAAKAGKSVESKNPLPPPPGLEMPTKEPMAAGAEKLVVFDRPFTLSVMDINLGVLLSGSVESLKKAEAPQKPKSKVFGMEKELAYLKCL